MDAKTLLNGFYFFALIVWCVLEIWISMRERNNKLSKAQDKGTINIMLVTLILGFVFSILASDVFPGLTFQNDILSIFGIIVIFAGISLKFWAVRTLNNFYTTFVYVDSDYKIIKHGPYKFTRHPAYTGGLIGVFGIALFVGNWASLAILLFFSLLGTLIRINVEEDAIQSVLEEEYKNYSKETKKKLIPFIL